MENSTVGDFIRQVPVGLLLAPVFFGALYVVLMVYIFQRGAARRRARREAALMGGATLAAPMARPQLALSAKPKAAGGFLRGELPDHGRSPAAWSIPAALRDLPEPDLEALSIVPLLTEPETVESAMNAPDWLSMLPVAESAEQEVSIVPVTPSLPSQPVSNSARIPRPSAPLDEPEDAVEVMRVWRDLSDGSLIIQMGEARYRSAAEITNAELSRRFSALVRELWSMISNGSTPNLPPPEGSAGGMKARIGLMNQQAAEVEAAAKPRGLLGTVTRGRNNQPMPSAKEEPRRHGIAGAVEEFLQYKLSNTPQFQTRSIHVRPSIDDGVRIEVDGHFYNGVGDVVDADVREFLLTVLREWEARQ